MKVNHFLLSTGFLVTAAFSQADTAYSNFADYIPGNGGWYVGGNNYHPNFYFTSTSTGRVTELEFYLAKWSDSTADKDYVVTLYATGSSKPGAILGSYSGTVLGSQPGQSYEHQKLMVDGPVLQAGTEYWIGLSSAFTDYTDTIMWGMTNRDGYLFDHNPVAGDLGMSAKEGAFQITTQPVPEPTSMVVLSAGAVALLRRRKKG